MIGYAWQSLVQSRGKLLISVSGIALSLILIVSLDAIMTGAEQRVTAHIEHAGADVIVSQAGVRTMHMGSSTIPASAADQLRQMQGVSSVTPVLYLSDVIETRGKRSTAYVIGLPDDARAGRPWKIAQGASFPAQGGAILDRDVTDRAGLRVGDRATILGASFRVDGLSEGTASLSSSVVVIRLDDFAAIQGSNDTVSFFFVQAEEGVDPNALAGRLTETVGGMTVQTTAQFASEERRLIRDMGSSVISLMNGFGLLVGLAVMSLSVYTAALSRRPELGALKAIGARNAHLYWTVLVQALIGAGLGLLAAMGVTVALASVVPRLSPGLTLAFSAPSLGKAVGAAFAIAIVAALLPIRQIAGLDPATVFRRR